MASGRHFFSPVNPKADFVQLEKKRLAWWYKAGVVKQYLSRNKNSTKRFSFLDGPITANNPMGVHHAWGRTYKDLWQRYKNMQGFRQRFQNGFDCQGLWVEVEVEKDLGFNSKKDIENFGLKEFSQACTARVNKYSRVQAEESIRLGQFMDWENSYYTFSDTNIEYIWYFLKKCYQRGWLYKGFRSLPWCARCGTSLSQHELFDSYEEMTHKAVFLKFPVKGRSKEFFLVWTTTPWTLAANVALAVHPELTYVKVETEGETLILAKDLLKVLNGKYKVLEEFKGTKLKGQKYEAPFAELPAQAKTQKVVLLWKDVSSAEGTGIVHTAPGCGEEDFLLAKENKLAVLVPIDENGNYIAGYGELTGKFAHAVNDLVFESLAQKGLLYKVEDYRHSYPICWRCKEPIVFRAEENWFITAREIRPKMIKAARNVRWHPQYVGKLMEDWLKNMGDWNISRKRYFGLPLPFYECKSCGELVIIGSKKELKELAVTPTKVDNLSELHRPWIDEVKIRCPKCGSQVERVTDVGDCWLDAGIVPFSTLKYLEDKRYWRQWFPADWISEMREQVRLWFYSMLFMSVTLEGSSPYRQVLSYEKVFDEKGQPMHKSAGNVIWFDEAAEKMGVDVIRWLYALQSPADDLLFGYHKADEVRRGFHLTLWNIYNFFITYANLDGWRQKNGKWQMENGKSRNALDRWIMARLKQTAEVVTKSLDNYDAKTGAETLENFVQDLSLWYVRRSRDRVGPSAPQGADKDDCHLTLHSILVTLSRLLAPFTPYLAEEIYKNLTGDLPAGKAGVSVHLSDWPKLGKLSPTDKKLISGMATVRQVVEKGHAARKEAKLPVRQPLSTLSLVHPDKVPDKSLLALLSEELNVKEIKWTTKKVSEAEVSLDKKLTPALLEEGKTRELARQIQDARKQLRTALDSRVQVVSPWLPKDKTNLDWLARATLAKLVVGKKFSVSKTS